MTRDAFTLPDVSAPCWRPFLLGVTAGLAVTLRRGAEPVLTASPLGAGRWELCLRQHPACVPFEGSLPAVLLAAAEFLSSGQDDLLAYARARAVSEPVGFTHQTDPKNHQQALCGLSPWRLDHGHPVEDDRRDDTNPTCPGCRGKA